VTLHDAGGLLEHALVLRGLAGIHGLGRAVLATQLGHDVGDEVVDLGLDWCLVTEGQAGTDVRRLGLREAALGGIARRSAPRHAVVLAYGLVVARGEDAILIRRRGLGFVVALQETLHLLAGALVLRTQTLVGALCARHRSKGEERCEGGRAENGASTDDFHDRSSFGLLRGWPSAGGDRQAVSVVHLELRGAAETLLQTGTHCR